MATKLAARDTDQVLGRAAGYSLLAFALAYPDDGVVASLREAAKEAALVPGCTPLSGLAWAAASAAREALEPVHVRLYTLSSSPDCPTFETAYFSPDPQQQTQRMADIAGFYRAFGVESMDSGFRPDDIPVELEFMAFLCRKQVYAMEHLGAPRVGQVVRAQRLFMTDHLGCWAGALGRRIAAEAPTGHLYQLAGIALSEWVADECRALGVQPEEVSGVPAPAEAPGVSHGPEFAGPAQNIFSFDEIPVG